MRVLSLLTALVTVASVHGWAGVTVRDARDRVFANAGTVPDSVLMNGQVFATGFHPIQGLAWHGRDLWISNSPDLTIVRDTNDDGKADDYVLMARHLGDEKHGLHGIAWGADGRLYLATGELALMPVRALGRPQTFHQGEYSPFPFTPPAGLLHEGAILRCDVDSRGLEVVRRTLINPQEVWFDDDFRIGNGKPPLEPPLSRADEKRSRPYDEWTFEELAGDLGSSSAAQSVAAQEELLRRGESIKVGMLKWLERHDLSRRQRTWALWTLGGAGKDDGEIEAWFPDQFVKGSDTSSRVQCLRIIAFRVKEFGVSKVLPDAVRRAVDDPDEAVRAEARAALAEAEKK